VIILDTNIASVLVRSQHPDLPIVTAWMESLSDTDVRITAITRAEMRYGIAILPDGSRKRALADSADAYFAATESQLLSFGAAEAESYAEIMAQTRADGHQMSILDAQIAAITKVANATLATRDADFAGAGIRTVNPYG
jgi:predicted nucleic acid-binding protein